MIARNEGLVAGQFELPPAQNPEDENKSWFGRLWSQHKRENEAKQKAEDEAYKQSVNEAFDKKIKPLEEQLKVVAAEEIAKVAQDNKDKGFSLQSMLDNDNWFTAVSGYVAERKDVKDTMIALRSLTRAKEDFNKSPVKRPVAGHGNNLWLQNDPDYLVKQMSRTSYFEAKRDYNKYLNTDNFYNIVKAELQVLIDKDMKEQARKQFEAKDNVVSNALMKMRNYSTYGTSNSDEVLSIIGTGYDMGLGAQQDAREKGTHPNKYRFYYDGKYFQPRLFARNPVKVAGGFFNQGQDKAKQQYKEDYFYAEMGKKLEEMCSVEQDRILDKLEALEKAGGSEVKIQQLEHQLFAIRQKYDYAIRYTLDDLAAARTNGKYGKWEHTRVSRTTERGFGDHTENMAKKFLEKASTELRMKNNQFYGLTGKDSGLSGAGELSDDLHNAQHGLKQLNKKLAEYDRKIQKLRAEMADMSRGSYGKYVLESKSSLLNDMILERKKVAEVARQNEEAIAAIKAKLADMMSDEGRRKTEEEVRAYAKALRADRQRKRGKNEQNQAQAMYPLTLGKDKKDGGGSGW